MVMNEQQFIRGFNNGYLLAKYEPLMLTAFLKDLEPQNSYIHGISYGQREYENEQIQSKLKELKDVKDRTDLGRDKDRII